MIHMLKLKLESIEEFIIYIDPLEEINPTLI